MNPPDQFMHECDECKEYVKTYSPLMCKKCKINLCDKCYSKRPEHVCKWCYSAIPKHLIVRRKTTKVLLFVVPILLLFSPVPKPVVFMFFDGTDITWWQPFMLFGIIICSIGLFLLLLKIDSIRIERWLEEPEIAKRSEKKVALKRKNKEEKGKKEKNESNS